MEIPREHHGSPGIGGPHHLAIDCSSRVTRLDIKHIPYQAPPARRKTSSAAT
jgi:hypothetical protein